MEPQEAPEEPLIIEKLKNNRLERRRKNQNSSQLKSAEYDINIQIMHEKGRPRDKYEMDQWNDGESDQDARLP